jgi:hypothetical protein
MISNRFAGGGVIRGTQQQIERRFNERARQFNPSGGPVAAEMSYLTETGGKFETVYLTGRDLAEFQAEEKTGFQAMKDYFLKCFKNYFPQNPSTPHIVSGRSFKTQETMELYTCRDGFD